MKTVEVDGKKFTKTAQFGNRKARIIHVNKRAYNRKHLRITHDEC